MDKIVLDPATLDSPKLRGSQILVDELSKLFELEDKASGIVFSGRLINANRLKKSKKLYIDIMPLIQDYESPLVEESYLAFSTACPLFPILSICIEETKLSKAQLQKIKKDGISYLANALLKALAVFKDKEKVICGSSFGGLLLASVMARSTARDFNVSVAHFRDPAGIRPLSYMGLSLRFAKDYRYDEKLAGKKDGIPRKSVSSKNRILSNIIRKGTFTTDLLAAFRLHNNLQVWFSYGDKDLVCSPKDIEYLSKTLEQNNFKNNFRVVEIVDYGHFRGKYNWRLSYLGSKMTLNGIQGTIASILSN